MIPHKIRMCLCIVLVELREWVSQATLLCFFYQRYGLGLGWSTLWKFLFSCPRPQLRCEVSSVAHICFNFFLSRTSERWWLWHEGHFLFFIFFIFFCTPTAAYLSCICDLSFFYNLVQSGLVSGFHFFFIKIFNRALIRKKSGGGYHIWAELMAAFLSQVDMHTRWSWSWSFTQICTLHTDLINLNHDEHF